MSTRVLMVALFAAVCLDAQIYPGGYPPGGYPPGGYPPGSYPPGQYPAGGSGIPLPGRNKKDKADNKKAGINLNGTIAKQDGVKSTLTINADDGRNIDLKVSNDTKITGDAGKLTAADLHVGDEITVGAHTDDKGYFYADQIHRDKAADINTTTTKASPTGEDPDDHRPILHRAGSASADTGSSDTKSDSSAAKTADAKPAASKPATRKDDEFETGEEHPIIPPGGVGSTASSGDPDRPILRRGGSPRPSSSSSSDNDKPSEVATNRAPAAPNSSPAAASGKNDEPEIHTDPDAPAIHYTAGSGDEFIQKAREAAFEFDQKLPNFVCQQMVTRYQSETRKPDWHAVDTLSYDLVYEDGEEQYKNPKINGKAVKAGADKDSGSWSSGEFGTLLKDIFHPTTAADFHAKGQESIAHRTAKVYTFAVDKEHSHWRIQGGNQWILPAYTGTIWIDKETFRALRIEMEAVNMPKAFVLDHTESAADYDFVTIKEQKVLLPTHAEVLSCERGTFNCSRNTIDFRNYHAYTGESSISFGDPK